MRTAEVVSTERVRCIWSMDLPEDVLDFVLDGEEKDFGVEKISEEHITILKKRKNVAPNTAEKIIHVMKPWQEWASRK